MTKLEEFDAELQEVFEGIFRFHGLDQLSTKLLALLYVSPSEISMEDLASKTGYSLSAVSTNLKAWENYGLIEKRSQPGSKKRYYYMTKDLRILNIRKLRYVLDTLKKIKSGVPILTSKYEKDVRQSKSEDFHKKLDIVRNYVTQLDNMERIFSVTLKDLENMK